MVREDAKAKEIDPKVGGKMPQASFDPLLSVVVVRARIGIVAHQEASTDTTLDDVSDSDFQRIKDLGPSRTCHGRISVGRQVH